MIIYPMSNRDALRSVMVRVPAAEVRFTTEALNQFRTDELNGDCVIEYHRAPPIVSNCDQYVIVRYTDPELEMLRKLEYGTK